MTGIKSNRETLHGYVEDLKNSVSSLCGIVNASTSGSQDCTPSVKMKEMMKRINDLLCKEKFALEQDAGSLIRIAEVLEETDGNIASSVGEEG